MVVTFTDLDSLSKGNVWPRASRAVRGLYYYKNERGEKIDGQREEIGVVEFRTQH